MEALLIIIGLACICWLASKALVGFGNALELISKQIEDRSLSAIQLQHRQEKATKRLEKNVKKLHAIKKAEEYNAQIKKQIEEMTQ